MWTPELEAELQQLESQYGNAAPKQPMAMTPDIRGNLTAETSGLKAKADVLGKTSGENMAMLPKAQQALNQAAYEAAKQLKNAGKVEEQVAGEGSWAVGPIDANTWSVLPSTVDTIANIDQIDSSNFINALSALKASSPTGASGLGSATEREGEKIQKANFNFDRAQSEPQFLRNIGDYKAQIRNSLKNTVDVFNQTYGTNLTPDDLIKQYEPDPEQTKRNMKKKYGLPE